MTRLQVDPMNHLTPVIDPKTGLPKPWLVRQWNALFGNDGTNASSIGSLETGKADAATQIITGTGLTGGGDLSQDRTLTADEQAILDEISSTQGAVLCRM